MRHAFTIVAAALCLGTPLRAAELHVPGEYPTVQAALDAAEGCCHTIVVATGTYVGGCVIESDFITIVGAGMDETVLTTEGNGTVMVAFGRGVQVHDLTIAEGYAVEATPGLFVNDGGVINRVAFRDNVGFADENPASWWTAALTGYDILIYNSVFEGNTSADAEAVSMILVGTCSVDGCHLGPGQHINGGYVLANSTFCDASAGGAVVDVGGNDFECTSPCPADLDGDGVVDFHDLLAILLDWGPCP